MSLSIKNLLVLGFLSVAVVGSEPFSFDSSSYDPTHVIRRDVAIVGGGASGTYSAISLSDEGKEIVLIEKESILGGHTNTYTDPGTGTKVDYGVIAFWNSTIVQEYFARLGVATAPLSGAGATNSTAYVDFQTGTVLPSITASTDLSGYQAQLEKYPYLLQGWDLPNPVPEDLLLTFGEFVEKYSLQDVAFTLFAAGPGGGLGNILDQLAVSVLRADSLAFIEETEGAVLTTAAHNNQQLYEVALQELGSNVVLDSTVLAARRNTNQSVELVVATPSGNKLIIASQLLVTIPLTLDNLSPFNLDESESSLFGRFQNTAFYTGLLTQPGLSPGVSYVNVGANSTYHIPQFPALYHVTPTSLEGVYSFWYGGDQTLVEDEVKANISSTVKRLTGNEEPVEFITFASHTPFNLHVSAKEIAAGFYSRLNKLQGHRNTWYTGSVFTPSAATVWNFTQQLLPLIIDALE